MHLTALLLILTATGSTEGWECNASCSTENGFCERPGKCRCKPGWEGEDCTRCLSFPGCLHGTCQKAWQCLCEDGWVGSLCDQDTRRCSSSPCVGNATCIETGEGGYLCVCPPGYTGERCHLRRGGCHANSSPCQNGGTCTDAGSSCSCPPGFSGDLCEDEAGAADSCRPDPCLNGGSCRTPGPGLAFACSCPPGFAGFTCNDTLRLSPCAGQPCANGSTCVGQPDGTFRCACPKWSAGPTCGTLQHRPRARPRPRPADHKALALAPQHYSLPAHAFHRLLRPPERDLLKITLKETVHSPGVLVTQGQLVCFGILALLTCLVILGTTGIVFFGRCETWLANAKYSQLVRQQREHLLREAGGGACGGGGGHEEAEHSVNIILPEKIRLTSFGRNYTSI